MKAYRVSIWASVDVSAKDAKEAEEKAHDLLITGGIRMREFEFDAEQIDGDQ